MLNVFPLTKTENPSMGIQQPAQGVGVAQECVPLGAAVPTPPVRNGNATVHRAENGFSCFAGECFTAGDQFWAVPGTSRQGDAGGTQCQGVEHTW